jgi:hypothetical protein
MLSGQYYSKTFWFDGVFLQIHKYKAFPILLIYMIYEYS